MLEMSTKAVEVFVTESMPYGMLVRSILPAAK